MTLAAAEALDPAVRSWVEDVCGSPLVAARRMDRWRPTWWVDVGGSSAGRHLVLKTPRAPQHVVDRSAMLTEFGIDREAAVLQALSDGPVPVPPHVGHEPRAHLLLIGAVGGQGELQAVDPPLRAHAMAGYGAALARLHDLDPAGLRAGGVCLADLLAHRGPRHLPGPLAAVVADRGTWDAPDDPLVEFALDWMREHEPALGHVLLHGDAGANQFLLDAHGLTAVLDWELAHLGDPLSDLGYARYREALYPSGAYAALVDSWSRTSGRPLDRAVLDWHTVAACLVMLIGIARDLNRPRAGNSEAVQRLWWDALSRAALCQVLIESSGGSPAAPVDVPRARAGDSAAAPVADLLVQRLLRQPAPGAGTQAALREHRHTVALAQALHRLAGLPPRQPALAAGLDELAAESLVHLAAMAPLAVSDTWGALADEEDESWKERLGRPVLPPLPAAARSGEARS